MKNKIFIIIWLWLIIISSYNCNKILDQKNPNTLASKEVWENAAAAESFLMDIYDGLMPKSSFAYGEDSDEGIPYQKSSDPFMLGTATFISKKIYNASFPINKLYVEIRNINLLLENVQASTKIDTTDKMTLRGQAMFWRAWAFYKMTKDYGGVSLLLKAQPYTEGDTLKLDLPRNKTSECVKQIITDLDSAFALVPNKWIGKDVGKIDKTVVLALKARILNFFASPLFNGLNGTVSWPMAYEVNRAAKKMADDNGFGLFEPYNKIWDEELNKEQIMFRRLNYPQSVVSQTQIQALKYSKEVGGSDRPSLELVNAFPMKDGSSWDTTKMSYDTLFKNRDDRFYANIYYNGSPNTYLQDMNEKKSLIWTYYNTITDYNGAIGVQGAINQVSFQYILSGSSFYRIKGIDRSITVGQSANGGVDYPEIRYAEVLMNYGEAANETDKPDIALDVLYQIRKRAGILPGANGKYGITATSKDDIRKAYQKERFVEFAFEIKRLDDLRRWKMFDYLRKLPQRHGLGILLKPGEADVKPMDSINQVWNKFTSKVISLDREDIKVKDEYYIFCIPKENLEHSPLWKQNISWGGEFDPMQ